MTRKSVCNKINGVEPPFGAVLVRHTAAAVAPPIEAMGGQRESWLPGYRVRIPDGSHLPGTEHRLKPLRIERAGALPGQPGDPRPATDVGRRCHPLPGRPRPGAVDDRGDPGHGPTRRCVDRRPELLHPALLFGIVGQGSSSVIRQYASTRTWEAIGPPEAKGRCATGAVFEPPVRLTAPSGESLPLRRITRELDQPTRDGDREIQILTDLPEEVADAVRIADLDRPRWTLETAFQEIAATLNGEIDALGYPRAALFTLGVALVAYNSDERGQGGVAVGPRAAGASAASSEIATRSKETESQERQWLPEEALGDREVAQGSTASQMRPPTQGWLADHTEDDSV